MFSTLRCPSQGVFANGKDSLGSGSRANRRVAAVVDEMSDWTPALLLGLAGDFLHPGVDMHIINHSPASPQIGFVLYSPKAAAVTNPPREGDGEEELPDEHCCIICLDTMEDPSTVEGCHHTFCGECLDAWLERSDRSPSEGGEFLGGSVIVISESDDAADLRK
ncbi:hypothetical protein FOZ62_030245 [Perkinsus olseni]|uniref:RING-type domain-containing protein n=1 Tax=Perkinsus olseni TaxID=32597 RepID=A0A7J6S3Q4_PEROL|nr:hypothetical protein FOZ62_030245 [Perkinsus olseni]